MWSQHNYKGHSTILSRNLGNTLLLAGQGSQDSITIINQIWSGDGCATSCHGGSLCHNEGILSQGLMIAWKAHRFASHWCRLWSLFPVLNPSIAPLNTEPSGVRSLSGDCYICWPCPIHSLLYTHFGPELVLPCPRGIHRTEQTSILQPKMQWQKSQSSEALRQSCHWIKDFEYSAEASAAWEEEAELCNPW